MGWSISVTVNHLCSRGLAPREVTIATSTLRAVRVQSPLVMDRVGVVLPCLASLPSAACDNC